MSDLEGMINGILSNPDEMKKIMDMAGKIMGTEGDSPAAEPANTAMPAMPSLDNILSGLGGGMPGGGIASAVQGLMGSSTIQKLLGSPTVKNLLSGTLNTKNDKRELFEAMKPWISEKRKYKLEKAIIFARVMRVAGAVALKKGG